ncbi:hypothetical protein Ait01nite_020160 [Actinoplanes italicus]|uniref:Uncharacterized protein n=1 Tax=Actinoplanes italicus TaxID=113567 RepID=A0A2T0KPS6_9ACTN|nr:hypothetical protein [Actinoplanes italicus]PRX25585.1 hypothetical protein CLV67_101302 [Actinoplanes italicus]GIE28971.1 hypothetical protein Ait01nite_020160 [Actinoplanes italicus]
MSNPFEGIKDEDPLDGPATRTRFLDSAKRGFAPLRKIFIQQPDTEENRASVLAKMVTARQENALDALLLLHALEPVLDRDRPLPLATWARMLSSEGNRWSTQNVGRAFEALEKRNLVAREAKGRGLLVLPRLEDGSDKEWTRPGSDSTTIGKGYLTIPYTYWTSGLADRLAMPGKAMFLILLSETTQKPNFAMAVARAQSWYGISERTAERGYDELRKQKVDDGMPLLLEHTQWVADHRSPTGKREVRHRALSEPYSQAARAELQRATATAARRGSKTQSDTPPKRKRLKRKLTGNKAGGKKAETVSA